MPPPLAPVPEPAPAPAPIPAAPAKRSRWGRLFLYSFLFILLLTVGIESVYILYFQDEVVADNQNKAATVVGNPNTAANTPAPKPIDVQATAGPGQNAAAAYLQSLNIPVASGSNPRIWINGQVYHIGDVVNPQFGLRWIQLNDQTAQLEFIDKDGHRYIKKF
jgi:hypothetical protein